MTIDGGSEIRQQADECERERVKEAKTGPQRWTEQACVCQAKQANKGCGACCVENQLKTYGRRRVSVKGPGT